MGPVARWWDSVARWWDSLSHGRARRCDMDVEKQPDEVSLQMSWEDVMEQFPYGLPASLRPNDRQQSQSNVVDLEQFRAHRKPLNPKAGHRDPNAGPHPGPKPSVYADHPNPKPS